MSDEPWYLKWEHRWPWAILGVFIAIAGILITLYLVPKPADISYQIMSESNVLDVHEPVKDLKIYFKNKDIQEKKLNLRIYSIRIFNTGGTDILESQFDSRNPWGLEFSKSEIVESPRIMDSNSQYLKDNIEAKLSAPNFIEFRKIIIEKGKYFTIEVLVLHPTDSLPNITVRGKIAGIENPVVKLPENQELSFVSKIFYGNWTVQVIRFLIFFILVIISFLLIAFTGDRVQKYKKWRIRNRILAIADKFIPPLDVASRKVLQSILRKTGDNIANLKIFLTGASNDINIKQSIDMYANSSEVRKKRMIKRGFIGNTPSELLIERKDGTYEVNVKIVTLLSNLVKFIEDNSKE